jgi:hypothetical protein
METTGRVRRFAARSGSEFQKKKEMAASAAKDFAKIREVLAPEPINQGMLRSMEQVRARIEELGKLCESEDRDARELRECMPELLESQAGLFGLCKDVAEARRNDGFSESHLFRLAVDVLFDDEIHRLQARELENRKQLQKWLGEVKEHIAREEVADWCARLTCLAEELERAAEVRERADADVAGAMSEGGELEALEKELSELEREAEEEALAAPALAAERAAAEEEWFKQVQRNTQYAKWYGGNVGVREIELEMYSAHYWCSVCAQRMCACVLKKCAHPMCRECADAALATGECPICKTPFKENHIIRFFYTP